MAEDEVSEVRQQFSQRGYTFDVVIDESPEVDTYRLKFGEGTETFAAQFWHQTMFPAGLRQAMFKDPVSNFEPLEHLNIAKIMEIFEMYGTILVIYRYPRPPKSNLEAERNNWVKIPVVVAKEWMHGVAKGLAFLHSRGYAHRNLNMKNILIKSRRRAQISSFSQVPVDNNSVSFGNLVVTMRPPEVLPNQQLDLYKSDVWTYGVILFLLISSRDALVIDPENLFGQWQPEKYNEVLLDEVDEWQKFAFKDDNTPQGAKILLRGILQINEENRKTMNEIANDGWFQSEEQPVDERLRRSSAQVVDNANSQVFQPVSDKLRNELKARGIKMLNYISKGSFGAVYRVQLTKRHLYPAYGHELAALKVCNLKDASYDYREVNSVREREFLRNVEHNNIIQFIDLIEDSTRHFCILMELAKGDLNSIVSKHAKDRTPYEAMELDMKKYLRDICQGMAHLHGCGWAHRDMKPDNCLIKLNGDAAIADFSFAREVGPNIVSSTFIGTLSYEAPQIVFETPYNPKAADVWAIGCTIFEALADDYLFNLSYKDSELELSNKIEERTETVQNAEISNDAKDLVYQCLCYRESDRPDMDQVLEHRFFHSQQVVPGEAGPSSPEVARADKDAGRSPSGRISSSGVPDVRGEKRPLEKDEDDEH